MAKRINKEVVKAPSNKRAAKVVAPIVTPQPAIVANAKLTKRNLTPSNAVLIATGKPVKVRSAHTTAAWAAVSASCPAPAAELAALPVFSGEHQAALVSGPAFVSYMQRRGYLAIK